MDIFIYAASGFGLPRDIIAEAIDEFLGSNGEVTGSGTGDSGSNIDVEIFSDDDPVDPILQGLRSVLRNYNVHKNTIISIGNHEFMVYE